MCWASKKANKKVADKNIPIFKVCSRTTKKDIVLPIYRQHDGNFTYFVYKLGIIYKDHNALSDIRKVDEGFFSIGYHYDLGYYEINRAYHSYSLETVNIKFCTDEGVLRIMHGETKLDTFWDRDEGTPYFVIVEGYIPKGSEYYLNENGEYVSDAICLTNINDNYVLGK